VLESSKKLYLVMELASKGSLSATLPLSEDKAKRYFKQLVEALNYLHNTA
jgi:serine/threonine protein kinase